MGPALPYGRIPINECRMNEGSKKVCHYNTTVIVIAD